MASNGLRVTLTGGTSCSLAAYLLALRLERAGYRLRLDGDDVVVEPGGGLSVEDRQELQAERAELIRLLTYQACVLPEGCHG